MTTSGVDVLAVRTAAREQRPDALLAAITGHDLRHALQRIGAPVLGLAWTSREHARLLAPAIAVLSDSARQRAEVGDVLLADDLMALAAGRTIDGIVLPVHLQELEEAASDHNPEHPGAYLNLRTGEVVAGTSTDPFLVGEEWAVDIEESEDDWLHVLLESHDAWNDMDEFAATVADPRLAPSLQEALHRHRPFAHFKDAVHRAGIAPQWYDFEEERQYGRLRALLARDGVHPV